MSNENMMPDLLPSSYNSWLQLYLEAIDRLKGNGQAPDDLSEVNLSQLEYPNESGESTEVEVFTNKWPMYILKSRALDELLHQLPEYFQWRSFLDRARQSMYERGRVDPDENFEEFYSKLMKLVPENFKLHD